MISPPPNVRAIVWGATTIDVLAEGHLVFLDDRLSTVFFLGRRAYLSVTASLCLEATSDADYVHR